MDNKIGGQKNRWMVGWMDRNKIIEKNWMDRKNRRMVGWIFKMYGSKNKIKKMDGWMDKTNRWMVGRKNKIDG